MDPFSFYDISPAFHVDEKLLRKAYLTKQKEWHPDFHSSGPGKEEALKQTSLNNEYYGKLSHFMGRVKLILMNNGMSETSANVLPSEFLMEMMDLSDQIEEAVSGNEELKLNTSSELEKRMAENEFQLHEAGRKADDYYAKEQRFNQEHIKQIQALYQQYKYLLRLEKNLRGEIEI